MTATTTSPMRIAGLNRNQAQQLYDLVDQVAEQAGLTSKCIFGPDQNMYAVAYRRALMWAFRDGYRMTYQQIGSLFTGKNLNPYNHTSVMAGINKVREEGELYWSPRRKAWCAKGTEKPGGHDVRLREALQLVAGLWNELNPQNQLDTWKHTL